MDRAEGTVFVFVCTGRFRSFEEMRAFIEQAYTEDGDGIPSVFMREVALSGYEPGCIEAIHSQHPVPIGDLLTGSSYSEQWLPLLESTLTEPRLADAAICVFAPNKVSHPRGSSLEYLGLFPYYAD
jgi:hypothetical protein